MGLGDLPVDVAELVLAHAGLQGHGDIKGSAGGDGAANTGHGDDGNVLNLDIGGGLRNEYQALIQEV